MDAAAKWSHMSALGDAFRSAREARGLTLSDVAEHIHIRSVYLAAIEAEDWSAIGAPVYVRGFIRTYARFLGLDAEDLAARFSAQTPSAVSPGPAAAPASVDISEGERRSPSVWSFAAILVALVLVAFVGYEYFLYRNGASEETAAGGSAVAVATAAPSIAAPVTPSASDAPSPEVSALVSPAANREPIAKNALAIRLTERSWLRVVVDGTTAMEGIYPAGTVRTFTGKTALVRAGNAGGVDVRIGDRDIGTMGGAGDVAERSFPL
jgi:cytoskeletal protein RodZ